MEDLIRQAKAGDGDAFDRLTAPLRPLLLSYLQRRIGDRAEAEDLCQETLMAAYTGLANYDGVVSFKAWFFQLASHLADPVSEGKDLWGESALDVLQDYLLEHEAAQQELQAILEEYDEKYSVADHVDFCFSVFLQTLFGKEREVLLLARLDDFSLVDASRIATLPLPEAKEKLEDAEDTLREALNERCSLVRPGAPCTQCRDFARWLGDEAGVEAEIQELSLRPALTHPEASFADRLALVKGVDPASSESAHLHEAMMLLLRRALGEIGKTKE